MGSSEEELRNYYVESTVFVAVGKHLKESESVLSWAAHKFGAKMRICILHVYQPPPLLSFFDGKLAMGKFKQRAIHVLRESDLQKFHKLISQYIDLLSQMGVRGDRMWIEMDNVEEGIVKMIVQHGIKWLVMGAAADKHYKRGMSKLKSQKAIFVCEQAPVSCHIWFTCRGNLIYTRKGPGVDISLATESLDANVATKEPERVRLNNSGVDTSSEQQFLPSLVAEEAEHVRVEGPGADKLSLGSNVSTEESELESESESELESPVSNLTTEQVEHVSWDEIGTDTKSLDLNVVAKEPGYLRTDCLIDEHGSPPRLTFRERGTILRACSVDFDSHTENSLVLSSSHNISTSHDHFDIEKEGCESGKKLRMFRFRSSLDSTTFARKLEGKSKLRAPREIYDRLEQAIFDAETVKQMAFQESVKRWKAEEDAIDAKRKADAAESKCASEMNQRREVAEALEQQNLKLRKFKKEHETFERELPIIKDHCSALKRQIRESEIEAKELEEKIISAVELLISFRGKRDQLELERDKAIQEVESLKRLKKQRATALSGPQFSTFSLLEIGEATGSFDPSKRIGDGMHGSIYQGVLHHMEVTIRMLPNDGFQSQWMFEHEVEILSRMRHPNIVTLIGICPEARSVVYEYLERGSLEDHLACRGKSHPLQWQTRFRIAAELCSALIFLHTSNPPVSHGNLKSTNILLDANFVSKISDFGIFRLISHLSYKSSQYYTSVYTDPESLETGVLSPDSDVYSFGILLLQLLTGKATSGTVKEVKWSLQKDKLQSVLDSSAGKWPVNQATSLAQLALRCCDRRRSKRPDLASEVWSFLEPLRKSCNAQVSCFQKENRRPPSHFLCPIYQEVMKDPCTAEDGYTYEGDAIRAWFDSGRKTSPMTNLKLSTSDLIPNHALQYAIQEWLQQS